MKNFHEFCNYYRGIDFYTKKGRRLWKFEVFWSKLTIPQIDKELVQRDRPDNIINY
jgi:hypothetical protein